MFQELNGFFKPRIVPMKVESEISLFIRKFKMTLSSNFKMIWRTKKSMEPMFKLWGRFKIFRKEDLRIFNWTEFWERKQDRWERKKLITLPKKPKRTFPKKSHCFLFQNRIRKWHRRLCSKPNLSRNKSQGKNWVRDRNSNRRWNWWDQVSRKC